MSRMQEGQSRGSQSNGETECALGQVRTGGLSLRKGTHQILRRHPRSACSARKKVNNLRHYSLEISVPCAEEDRANSISASLNPDNEGYVQTSYEEGILKFRMESEGAGALRQTADDLLACLKVAEDISKLS